jgi:ribA/ribD-fused uncharacterized protein
MLNIWTSQYRYSGRYRLDITVKGQDIVGKYFAPSWPMVNEYKARGVPTSDIDDVYMRDFVTLMKSSIQRRADLWEALLSSDYVVLVCFCKEDAFCHRLIVAAILEMIGGKYHGELPWKASAPPVAEGLIDNFHATGYRWLSNMHLVDVCDEDDLLYVSVENYYQAHKDIKANRPEYVTITPKAAKKKGQRVDLPDDWKDRKFQVMKKALQAKFSNFDLACKLLSTGMSELIEGNNWHDNIWGQCNCPECSYLGGYNYLGKMLMEIRSDIIDALIQRPLIYDAIADKFKE